MSTTAVRRNLQSSSDDELYSLFVCAKRDDLTVTNSTKYTHETNIDISDSGSMSFGGDVRKVPRNSAHAESWSSETEGDEVEWLSFFENEFIQGSISTNDDGETDSTY
jgi:hypothetical protein